MFPELQSQPEVVAARGVSREWGRYLRIVPQPV